MTALEAQKLVEESGPKKEAEYRHGLKDVIGWIEDRVRREAQEGETHYLLDKSDLTYYKVADQSSRAMCDILDHFAANGFSVYPEPIPQSLKDRLFLRPQRNKMRIDWGHVQNSDENSK